MDDKIGSIISGLIVAVIMFVLFAKPIGYAIHDFMDAVQGKPEITQTGN